jgi:hypothetical protein
MEPPEFLHCWYRKTEKKKKKPKKYFQYLLKFNLGILYKLDFTVRNTQEICAYFYQETSTGLLIEPKLKANDVTEINAC